MIGAILLAIAILLFFIPKYRYLSYFLYISFMLNGLNLWNDMVTGAIKTMDMAVVYTFVIGLYLFFNNQWIVPRWQIRKYYIAAIVMVGVCALFSFVHYNLSAYQILQGGRSFLLLFSLPILIRVNSAEMIKVMRLLLFFCVITSILYIAQIILRRPMMPYGEVSTDPATGLPRFYNSPINLVFFLTLTFLMPKFFKHKVRIYQVLFFTAMVCTLGRTYMVTAILTIFLALLMQGKLKRIGTTIAVLLMLVTPFIGVINERFAGGGGTSDFTDIANGNYQDYEGHQDGGTMVYRFAWVYERWEYMQKQPLSELLFGLGFASDLLPWSNQHYKFTIGLYNNDTGNIAQLSTPDISYGNLLSKLGLLGGVIYLAFAISMAVFLYKNRKVNVLILLAASQMITTFLGSFSGAVLSDPKNFAMTFMILSILYRNRQGLISKVSK